MTFAAYRNMGFNAAKAGAVRLAPISLLLAQREGFGPLDAWYEGFDEAKGCGPYFGTTAEAVRAAYVPKGLPSKLRDAA